MAIRRNLVRDPAASSLSNWSADASSGTPTIATVSGSGPVSGVTTFARVTATGSVTYLGARIGAAGVQLVSPGSSYALSAYMTPVTAGAASSSVIIRWLNSVGGQVGTSVSSPAVSAQGVASRASVVGVAPVGAARAEALLRVTGSFVSGNVVDVSAALFELGSSVDAFFMGGIAGAVWDGAVGLSTSALYIPLVALNPETDAAPCPRVEVLITDLPPTATTIDVYRLAAGREYLMRGGVAAAVNGAFTRIDFEIPFGVPVQYRAEMFDGSGLSLGFTIPTTVQVDVAETWVHNPLNPQGATVVAFQDTATRSLSRPVDGEVLFPLSRSVGVIVAGQRRGLVDAVLDVVVDTVEQADAVQAMLGGYDRRAVPVICFRIGSADRIRIPRPLFAGVLTLSENDMTYTIGTGEQIAFPMSGTEVDPPTPALVVPLLTRADMNAAYPTRAALNAAYLTRLDANRDYSLAGTAP